MNNVHQLKPCATCPTRMAVPGSPVCTVCDAVVIPREMEQAATRLMLLAPDHPVWRKPE